MTLYSRLCWLCFTGVALIKWPLSVYVMDVYADRNKKMNHEPLTLKRINFNRRIKSVFLKRPSSTQVQSGERA